jgi:hypothetical protein
LYVYATEEFLEANGKEDKVENADSSKEEWNKMTVIQLRAELRNYGIKPGQLRKAELIDLLLEKVNPNPNTRRFSFMNSKATANQLEYLDALDSSTPIMIADGKPEHTHGLEFIIFTNHLCFPQDRPEQERLPWLALGLLAP